MAGCQASQRSPRADHATWAMRHYGCASCHEIPGVPGARGHIGPSLASIGNHEYLAGALMNTRENMLRWIRTPEQIDSRTVMPDTGVSERDASDIADYLYGLR